MGLIVIAGVVLGCLGLAFFIRRSDYARGIAEVYGELQSSFRFSNGTNPFRLGAPCAGTLDGNEASIRLSGRGAKAIFLIRVKGKPFLPEPLEIARRPHPLPEGFRSDADLPLAAGDLAEMRGEPGGRVIADELLKDLKILEENSLGYSAYGDEIRIAVAFRDATGRDVKRLLLAACRVMMGFGGMRDKPSFLFRAILHRLTHAEGPGQRERTVSLLVRLTGSDPAAGDTLDRLCGHAEFSVGLAATAALGKSRVDFAIARLESSAAADRSAAVRKLCELADPRGLNHLIDCFRRLPDYEKKNLRLEIVRAFREFPNDRSCALFELAVGDDGYESTRLATADALAELGTKDTLDTLYLVAGNDALSQKLRDRARSAMDAIRARLGVADTGRLSLADGGTADGGLSVADGAPGGAEKPGENDAPENN